MKTKKLGESNATHAQIMAWMDEYKKSRTYDIRASLSWPPSASEKQIGNCQTMVYFLADKMGVDKSDLNNSNYNGHDIILIPSQGPKRNVCSVVAGSCTGSLTPFFGGYDSKWCGRCGHYYCPYHAPYSETFKAAGGCHTCYSK